MGDEERVLAMYDIRGIQKYIYRTSRLKDAMGASMLVDNIITRALKKACESCKELSINDREIEWEDSDAPKPYNHADLRKVQVLYIGGGNAFVSFCNKELCIKINKRMSRYIIEQTYSLQLAVAWIPMTENYAEDYKKIFEKMNQIKSDMVVTRPLGSLPIMEEELKTGLPVSVIRSNKNKYEKLSKETVLKRENKNRKNQEEDIDKILDNYARRGQDSRIAVVHIDGNNMGLRIRKLIENITDYQDAVTKMRRISYNIKYSYLNTFNQMKEVFENKYQKNGPIKRFIRKVIVAGDDITYVCNAYIAMETVEWFCRKISKLTMNAGLKGNTGEIQDYDIQEYGFSVCAGIAYIRSHFPFGMAYEVAESCCGEAKSTAKADENKVYYEVTGERTYHMISCQDFKKKAIAERDKTVDKGSSEVLYPYYFEKTGNFFDFQICKNIQCADLEKIREQEFITATGEELLIRPYYIPMPEKGDPLNTLNAYAENGELKPNNYESLKRNIEYFADQKNIPHSFAKRIRNTYSLGKSQIGLLAGFLDSRHWKMPDKEKCTNNMYLEKGANVKKYTAKWYDALEIIDYNLLERKIEEGDQIDEDKKN